MTTRPAPWVPGPGPPIMTRADAIRAAVPLQIARGVAVARSLVERVPWVTGGDAAGDRLAGSDNEGVPGRLLLRATTDLARAGTRTVA